MAARASVTPLEQIESAFARLEALIPILNNITDQESLAVIMKSDPKALIEPHLVAARQVVDTLARTPAKDFTVLATLVTQVKQSKEQPYPLFLSVYFLLLLSIAC